MGWLGNFLTIIGLIVLAYQLRVGFVFCILGGLCWGWRGYTTDQNDLLAIEIVIIAIQVFSWYNWGKSNTQLECQCENK
jgi:hypothetical protein